MIEKKLITLVGAAGILACGACFLPPMPEHHPEPPLGPGPSDIHEVRVEVANEAKSNHLGAAAFAAQITQIINERQHGSIRAHVSKEAGDGDAVVRVVISGEEAGRTSPPGNAGQWRFRVTAAATLTRPDGSQVAAVPKREITVMHSFDRQTPSDPWADPSVTRQITAAIANRLVFPALYAH